MELKEIPANPFSAQPSVCIFVFLLTINLRASGRRIRNTYLEKKEQWWFPPKI
jgi:hypothetical protein